MNAAGREVIAYERPSRSLRFWPFRIYMKVQIRIYTYSIFVRSSRPDRAANNGGSRASSDPLHLHAVFIELPVRCLHTLVFGAYHAHKLAARFVYPKLADRLLDPPTQEKNKWQNSKPLKCKRC
jgi:hypothetical protein